MKIKKKNMYSRRYSSNGRIMLSETKYIMYETEDGQLFRRLKDAKEHAKSMEEQNKKTKCWHSTSTNVKISA